MLIIKCLLNCFYKRNLSCHIDTLGKRKCNSWKKLLKSNYKLSPIPRYLECHSQLELGFWLCTSRMMLIHAYFVWAWIYLVSHWSSTVYHSLRKYPTVSEFPTITWPSLLSLFFLYPVTRWISHSRNDSLTVSLTVSSISTSLVITSIEDSSQICICISWN